MTTPTHSPNLSLASADERLHILDANKDQKDNGALEVEYVVDPQNGGKQKAVPVKRDPSNRAGNSNSPAAGPMVENRSQQIDNASRDARPRAYSQRVTDHAGARQNGLGAKNGKKPAVAERIQAPVPQGPANAAQGHFSKAIDNSRTVIRHDDNRIANRNPNECSGSLDGRARVSDAPSFWRQYRENLNWKHGLATTFVGAVIGGVVGTLAFPGVGTVIGLLGGIGFGSTGGMGTYGIFTGLRTWLTPRQKIAGQHNQPPAGPPLLERGRRQAEDVGRGHQDAHNNRPVQSGPSKRDLATGHYKQAIKTAYTQLTRDQYLEKEVGRDNIHQIGRALVGISKDWLTAMESRPDFNSDQSSLQMHADEQSASLVIAMRDRKEIASASQTAARIKTAANAAAAAKALVHELILGGGMTEQSVARKTVEFAYASSLYTQLRRRDNQHPPTRKDYEDDLERFVHDACQDLKLNDQSKLGHRQQIMRERVKLGSCVRNVYQAAGELARELPKDGLLTAAADAVAQTLRTTTQTVALQDRTVHDRLNSLDDVNQVHAGSVETEAAKVALLNDMDKLAFVRNDSQRGGANGAAIAGGQNGRPVGISNLPRNPRNPASPQNARAEMNDPLDPPILHLGRDQLPNDEIDAGGASLPFQTAMRVIRKRQEREFTPDEFLRIETALRTITVNSDAAMRKHLPGHYASEGSSNKRLSQQATHVVSAMQDQKKIEQVSTRAAMETTSKRAGSMASTIVRGLMSQDEIDADTCSAALLELAYSSSLYTRARFRDSNQTPTPADYEKDLQEFVQEACKSPELGRIGRSARSERIIDRLQADGGIRSAYRATANLGQQLNKSEPMQEAGKFAHFALRTVIETVASNDETVQVSLDSLRDDDLLLSDEVSTTNANWTLLKDIDKLAFTRIDDQA